MPSLVITEEEIQVAPLRREHVDSFVQTYQLSIGHDPSDADIALHLECERKHDDVSWINLIDHYRDDVLAHKGVRLIEYANLSRCH